MKKITNLWTSQLNIENSSVFTASDKQYKNLKCSFLKESPTSLYHSPKMSSSLRVHSASWTRFFFSKSKREVQCLPVSLGSILFSQWFNKELHLDLDRINEIKTWQQVMKHSSVINYTAFCFSDKLSYLGYHGDIVRIWSLWDICTRRL